MVIACYHELYVDSQTVQSGVELNQLFSECEVEVLTF
jgi:hypothetical protein